MMKPLDEELSVSTRTAVKDSSDSPLSRDSSHPVVRNAIRSEHEAGASKRKRTEDCFPPPKRTRPDVRIPTCGSCYRRSALCNGALTCEGCRRKGTYCVYHPCKRRDCDDDLCTYLHSDQHSVDEGPERLVEGVNWCKDSPGSDARRREVQEFQEERAASSHDGK